MVARDGKEDTSVAVRDEPNPQDWQPIAKRWIEIALLAGAGATAMLAGLGVVNEAASWVYEQSCVGPSWYGIPVIIGAVLATAATLRRMRALPIRGRVLARLRYPSTWLAGLLGTAVLLAANVHWPAAPAHGVQSVHATSAAQAADGSTEHRIAPKDHPQWLRRVDAWPLYPAEAAWITAMTFLLGLAGFAAADWGPAWRRLPALRRPKPESAPETEPPKSELDFWLQPEGHDACGEDRLERKAIADRIASRLRSGRGAIELYGGFGSGKTTVLRMVAAAVDQKLDEHGRTVVVVRLSAWPKDTQAAHMVLTKLLDTAGCYVDVARVGGLADAFREAMNASDHWLLKMLHALTRGGDDYQQQLSALDSALGAVRVHVVLMLEDLDRAEDTTPLQVETMLDALKTMHNVSYVVAIGRLGAPN
jgi:hypothetical protein